MEAKEQKSYCTPIPAAPTDEKFKTDFKPVLISSEKELREVFEGVVGKRVACDTETYTLSPGDKDPVVGFSFSFSAYDGYYVPLRHKIGTNVAPDVALPILEKFLLQNQSIWYNLPFDMLMLGAEGLDWRKFKMMDAMALVYNTDTNIKRNGLKWASKHFLGREPATFADTVGDKGTFADIAPEDGYVYACADSANTFGIAQKLLPMFIRDGKLEQSVFIDFSLAKILPEILNSEICIDSEYMKELLIQLDAEIEEIENRTFERVGYPFNMDCLLPQQKVLTSRGPKRVDELYFAWFIQHKTGIGPINKQTVSTPRGHREIGAMSWKRVEEYYEITLASGDVVKCTGGHVFYVDRKNERMWVRADELTTTDSVLRFSDIKEWTA